MGRKKADDELIEETNDSKKISKTQKKQVRSTKKTEPPKKKENSKDSNKKTKTTSTKKIEDKDISNEDEDVLEINIPNEFIDDDDIIDDDEFEEGIVIDNEDDELDGLDNIDFGFNQDDDDIDNIEENNIDNNVNDENIFMDEDTDSYHDNDVDIVEEPINSIKQDKFEFNDDDDDEDYFTPDFKEDTTTEPITPDSKNSNPYDEPIFTNTKKIKLPLAGIVVVIVILSALVVCIVLFKNQIINGDLFKNFGINISKEEKENPLNEDEKRAYDLISKWLDNYTKTSEDIRNKIISYKINTVGLMEKNDNKALFIATYDVVPASIDNTNWIDDNGTRDGDTIKNKTRYFIIEKTNENYEIISSKAEKPDINENIYTLEKAIISIKSDFPDPDSLDLHSDSSLIDSLDTSKKAEIFNKTGGKLEDYYTITGSYRKTYILGTFLVNKENEKKWFVDDTGITTELKTCVQVLHLSDFEVQGDLSMSLEQAILTTFNLFPKGKRQSLTLVENWIENIDNIEKREEVISTLGDISDYYTFKTNTSKGFIAIKKNGLAKYFINTDGTITDLVEVKDITSILQ